MLNVLAVHFGWGSLHTTLACVALVACTLVACTLAACTPPAAEQDSVTDIAPGKGELRPVARIGHERIGECSGIVHHNGAFWVHNDSGDEPVLYRSLDLSFDDVEVLPVPGASAVDWEEIAIYGGDLLVCDIGDNDRERDVLTMYRARYVPADETRGGRVELVATYPFHYPDGAHDAEACFTIDGRLHIVNKDRGEGTVVYRFDELRDASALAPGEHNVPAIAGSLTLETREMVTGGAYDPESQTVILLTYSAILTYPKGRLSGSPEHVTRTWARQCEAICLYDDKLVFANEERDVFVVNDFLARGYSELLPPRGAVTLAVKSLDVSVDGTGSEWIDSATRIPLRDSRPGEALNWLLNEDQILIHGRLELDGKLQPTQPDSSRLGSTVLLMFAREPRQFISEEETHLAIGMDPSGCFAIWKLDLLGDVLGFEPVEAILTAQATAQILEFELVLPVSLIFRGLIPERFRFDTRGLRLHSPQDVYFSGPGFYSVQRPYVWGDVFVQR